MFLGVARRTTALCGEKDRSNVGTVEFVFLRRSPCAPFESNASVTAIHPERSRTDCFSRTGFTGWPESEPLRSARRVVGACAVEVGGCSGRLGKRPKPPRPRRPEARTARRRPRRPSGTPAHRSVNGGGPDRRLDGRPTACEQGLRLYLFVRIEGAWWAWRRSWAGSSTSLRTPKRGSPGLF